MKDYKLLLELMHEFSEYAFWNFIDSRDIFQVRLSKKDVYVSVLGMAGIEYGLIVYESEEDLSYQVMAENDSIDVEQPDLPFHLSSLKIDCKDGHELSKFDSSGKIYEYGIDDDCIAVKFSVGKPMRIVNEEECQLLIELLTIMLRHHEQIKGMDFEEIDAKETFSFKEVNHRLYRKVISFPQLIPPKYEVDENFEHEILDEILSLPREHEWLIGIFYSPAFVDENDEVYFPKICIVYDKTIDKVVDLIIPYNDEYDKFPHFLLESILRAGYLPEYLNIANYETLNYFANVLDALSIEGEVRMMEELNDIYHVITMEVLEDLQEENLVS